MHKLLVLSRFDESGAGPRYRVYQYFDSLKEKGIHVFTKPLLDSHYVNKLYASQKRSFWYLFKRYIQRGIYLLLNKSKFDITLMDGELFPFVPFFIEKLFLPKNCVMDQDDAIFHTYDLHKSFLVRFLLKNKIDKIMKHCRQVIVGNSYVEERARRAGAKLVSVIPTVVDAEKYKLTELTSHESKKEIIIGWVGSPSTAWSLSLIQNALQNIAKKTKFKLYVIGANYKIEGIDMVCNDWPNGWSESEEINLINEIDIGIMPLLDAPYQKGKCGFKLIKYMACSKPMIASAVGMNLEIVDHEKNGYLANSESEWEQYLTTLIENAELRKQLGNAGREKMLREYSLQTTSPVMCKIIQDAFSAASPSL